MFNVCPNCGQYRVDKIVQPNDNTHSVAICPLCDHAHPFLQLPLFIVTGASGSGKSTIALELSALTREVVVMETDILWDSRFNTPETNYREYREVWLRMAKNIGQAGKPVVLCGTAMPDQLEACLERRYFKALHYIALTCDNEMLEQRLKSRPSWRESGSEEFVSGMLSFNTWFKENAEKHAPKIHILDTTHDTSCDAALKLLSWIKKNWDE